MTTTNTMSPNRSKCGLAPSMRQGVRLRGAFITNDLTSANNWPEALICLASSSSTIIKNIKNWSQAFFCCRLTLADNDKKRQNSAAGTLCLSDTITNDKKRQTLAAGISDGPHLLTGQAFVRIFQQGMEPTKKKKALELMNAKPDCRFVDGWLRFWSTKTKTQLTERCASLCRYTSFRDSF